MGTFTQADGKVLIDKDSWRNKVTIIDKQDQENMDWSKVRLGDKFVMTHPRGIGYSATYSYVMTFDVVAYRDGCIRLSESNGRMFIWSGYIKLSPENASKITMENQKDVDMSPGILFSSDFLEFSESNIVTYSPVVKIDEIGKKIENTDELPDDGYYVLYEVGDNTYKAMNVLMKGKYVRNWTSRDRGYGKNVAFFLVKNIRMVEWDGGKIDMKPKPKYMSLHEGSNRFSFEDFDKDLIVSKRQKMIDDTWEDEEYKKYILINFDKTEKFYTSYY